MTAHSLPPELWCNVCEYLDRSSLKKISVANHRFRSIAVPLLFNAISIHQSKAAQLHQVLAQKAGNKHIRKLEVRDRFEPTLHLDDAFTSPHIVGNYFGSRNPSQLPTQDLSWEPVAALLASLPALTDLTWTCPQQFPRCLLHILHSDNFVGCKLHLRTFRLRSLALDEAAMDPYELQLVCSPNLYSIWYSYDLDDVSNNETFLPEAIFCTSRVAPNLRVLRLRQTIIRMTPMHPGLQPDVTMRQLTSYLPNTEHVRGQLERLQLTGPGIDLSPDQIVAWRDRIDFSLLRTLMLDIVIEEETIAILGSCHFTSLSTLSLYLNIEPGMMALPENRQEDTVSELAKAFLCSLPPLKQLRIHGELDHHCLRDVLRHHGSQLRKFELLAGGFSPHTLSLWPEEVLWVGRYCAELESLNLQMLRTRGDAEKVAAYSSLGSIPRLQTLLLTLDASDYLALRNDEGLEAPDWNPFPAPPKSHFDGHFDMEFAGFTDIGGDLDPRKGHLKDMFINAALDKNLVQAIVAKLFKAKPPRGLSFDHIEVKTTGGGDFGLGPIKPMIVEVMEEIQSSWVVENYQNATGHFNIRKINRDVLACSGNEDNFGDSGSGRLMDPRVESNFRHVWPNSVEGDWQNDWYSLPLA